MNITAIHSLFDYNYWVNQRILEAAVLLTQFGHSPGDLDYMIFLRDG